MSQTDSLPTEVPREVDPSTPTYELLAREVTQDFNSLEQEVVQLNPMETTRVYRLDGELYTGWTYQEFFDTEHRHRFTKFENGTPIWQIGYFDNLTLGHDFHMKDGYNYGSQKMWHSDGSVYINSYFLENEVQHGIQRTWSKEHLVRDALFDHGKLIFDARFDDLGNMIQLEGSLPSNYQKPNRPN